MGRKAGQKSAPNMATYVHTITKWRNYIWSLANKFSGKTFMESDDYFQEACLYLWDKKIEGKNSSYIGRMIRTAMSNLYKTHVKRVVKNETSIEGMNL